MRPRTSWKPDAAMLLLFLAVPVLHASPVVAQSAEKPPEVASGVNAELLQAAEAGEVERVLELLAKGASVRARDKIGRTPLMLAAIHGRVEAVKVLLENGSELDAANKNGGTAFWFAIVNSKPEVVAMLIEHGAGLTVDGRPALFLASDTSVAKVFLDRGVDVNVRDSTGNTALMVAAGTGKHLLASFLIAHGADVNAVNKGGATALSMASTGPFGRDRQMMKLLKKAGARK